MGNFTERKVKKVDVMAIEKLFYNNNAKTVVDVCQARGVTLLAASFAVISSKGWAKR